MKDFLESCFYSLVAGANKGFVQSWTLRCSSYLSAVGIELGEVKIANPEMAGETQMQKSSGGILTKNVQEMTNFPFREF